MTSIAEKLVQKRKNMILGVDKASGELGNDLLSAMVSANMDTELPESQRMSHEEVLARECSVSKPCSNTLPLIRYRNTYFLCCWT